MAMRSPAGFISAFFDPLKNPDAPTIGTATAGDATASVTFTAPANVGGSAITAYYAVSNPDQITTSGASSPITATGLSNGTAYTFNVWALNSYGPGVFSAATNSVTPIANLNKGLFAGGNISGVLLNAIVQITISTTGDSTSFGTLNVARQDLAACASTTRGIFAGGETSASGEVNTISYVTFVSGGAVSSFGQMTSRLRLFAGCNSSTRGLFGGGYDPVKPGAPPNQTNVINYITMASTGNTTSFGELTVARYQLGSASSSTRGLWIGGDGDSATSVIDYVTITTTGNATSFGNLSNTANQAVGAACSNSTIALLGGGSASSGGTKSNVIQQITIATTGNSTSFGQLTTVVNYLAACSSSTRAVWAGGELTSNQSNAIAYVTIATAGNATSFGTLSSERSELVGCSSLNGGVQ